MTEQASNSDTEQSAEDRREIVVVRAGARLLGVFAEEVACVVASGARPTPLPHATATVLGIVSVRGRVLTLLDSLALLGESRAESGTTPPPGFILALRGEEQLALAVESSGRLCETGVAEILPPRGAMASIARGTFQDGETTVLILDVTRLFAVATEGMVWRRRKRALEETMNDER